MVLREEHVTTRTPHVCHGCLRTLPPKSRMRVTVEADGDLRRVYWCAVCNECAKEYMFDSDGVMEGEFRQANEDWWESVRARVENNEGVSDV